MKTLTDCQSFSLSDGYVWGPLLDLVPQNSILFRPLDYLNCSESVWIRIRECLILQDIFRSHTGRSPLPGASIPIVPLSQPCPVSFIFRSVISAGVLLFPAKMILFFSDVRIIALKKNGGQRGRPISPIFLFFYYSDPFSNLTTEKNLVSANCM